MSFSILVFYCCIVVVFCLVSVVLGGVLTSFFFLFFFSFFLRLLIWFVLIFNRTFVLFDVFGVWGNFKVYFGNYHIVYIIMIIFVIIDH